MAGLSKDAFAIMAICEETNKCFGITVDKVNKGQYKFVWSFKINKDLAHREGFDSTSVKGNVVLDSNYPGCPYCGEKRFVMCPQCGRLFCHHGQKQATCPNCGMSGNIISVEQVDLKGGDY